MPVAESAFFMMFIMFMGSLAFAAMFGIFLMLITFKTPAWTFLKASMKHKPLIVARRRDRKVDIHVAQNYTQGMVTSPYGGFIVDPDSVYNEKKSGAAFLPVNAEVGITLKDDVLRMIDGLKRMGIDNIEEAEKIAAMWGTCNHCGSGIMDVDEKGKLVCPNRGVDIKKLEEKIINEVEKEKEGKPDGDPGNDAARGDEDRTAHPSAGYDLQL
jgi:Rieske Fe-S protein